MERVPDDLLIGGRWVAAQDGARFAVDDPTTGEQIASVASATQSDARAAVGAAHQAAEGWRFDVATGPSRRVAQNVCGHARAS